SSSFANWATLSGSSTAIPTNCKPLGPNSRCARTNSGISSRQGAHQVAQKLTTTTLPRHWESDCSWPEMSGSDSEKSAFASRGARSQTASATPPASARTAAAPIQIHCLAALTDGLGPRVNTHTLFEPLLLWSFVDLRGR